MRDPLRPGLRRVHHQRAFAIADLSAAEATIWNWLSIDILWVSSALRCQGYGRRLLEEAEAVARARSCRHARLDTCDFQTRDFYERLGYRVYAELPDFPEGHRQFHLSKDLAAAS